jgi:heme-degrading monooxygenase HmoA
MVEVEVLRTRKRDGGEYVVTAWVVTAEYDEWVNEDDNKK